MSGDYDVDARLAQGRPAVDDIGEYVRACEQLGYHHPDLMQVRDVYSGEDGLRLDALTADIAALTAVAAAADDAVRRQSELLATLAGAWSGHGAGVALDFLTRQQRAAVTVSAAAREAADAITALREELWRAVDAKVSATLAVDASHQGQRASWLAAARTVTTGAGDRSSASELIDQQVKPFVDNDVRVHWLPAMRAASATVEAAYDAAIARVRGAPDAVFEVPGGLGPQWTAPVEHDDRVEGGGAVLAAPAAIGPAAAVPAAVAPAGFAAPPAAPLAPPVPPPAEQPLAPPLPPSQPASPLGDLGGTPSTGTPSLGTGLSGLGQQLSDLLGGLTGAAGDASPELEPPELEPDEEPFDERDPDDPDVEADEEDEDDDEPEAEGEPTDLADAAPEAPAGPEDPAAVEPGPTPESTPTPVPPPMPEPGPQDVAAEPPEQTPCEIAADELPQVGE